MRQSRCGISATHHDLSPAHSNCHRRPSTAHHRLHRTILVTRFHLHRFGLSGLFPSLRWGLTPLTLYFNYSLTYPGTYSGNATVTSPPGTTNSVTVPVTVTQPPTPVLGSVPVLASLVSAASLTAGPIAPGEIVSLFGLFPTPGTATLHLGSDGKANRQLFTTQVLFNGAAAPA